MSTEEIPKACGVFIIPLEDGTGFSVRNFNGLWDTLPDEESEQYEALVYGLMHIATEGFEFLTSIGKIILENERNEQIEFEADDELIDAIAESKIIPFNRKN
tara:strand:- start:87 stop:392 length:306 start_codon:yes stop_codon:yes gene_type:complete